MLLETFSHTVTAELAPEPPPVIGKLGSLLVAAGRDRFGAGNDSGAILLARNAPPDKSEPVSNLYVKLEGPIKYDGTRWEVRVVESPILDATTLMGSELVARILVGSKIDYSFIHDEVMVSLTVTSPDANNAHPAMLNTLPIESSVMPTDLV